MRKLTKHIAALAMAVAVAVTAITPVTAEAKPVYPEKLTLYHSSANKNWGTYTSITISNLGKNDTIKKSSIKSSDESVMKVMCLNKNYTSYETQYFSKQKNSTYTYNNYSIEMSLLKIGKATLTFKIGKKSYSSKVAVCNYENPLKSAKILGTDYAKQVKEDNSYNGIKTSSTKKNQSFIFKANKNWKITNVNIFEYEKTGANKSYTSTHTQRWNYESAPKSNLTCNVGKIEKNNYYAVFIKLANTKTEGTQQIQFYINNPYSY